MAVWRILGVLTMIAMMTLAGCAPAGDPLKDTTWALTSLNGQPALAEPLVTLGFAEGRLAGSDGCNSYGTTYSVRGGKLSVGKEIETTLMGCAEPIMGQASAYTAALRQVAGYKLDGQQLTLLDAKGRALATFAAQSQELGGTSWTVTGYNNGQGAVTSVLVGSTLTADFAADGKLSGSAGCNRYMGSFETAEKGIKIGALGSTKMACHEPAGVMIQESQFLQALAKAATYRVDGGQLELRDADGALAVTLQKAG